MNDIPKVSIIMPMYNVAPYIVEAIESVRAQTYPYYEIILVDDKSSDSTVDIVRSTYRDTVRLMCLDSNHGQAYARNFGVKHAKGEYVTFFDSDDRMHPEKIEWDVRLLEACNKMAVVFSDFKRLFSDGTYDDISFFKKENSKKAFAQMTTEKIFEHSYMIISPLWAVLLQQNIMAMPITVRKTVFLENQGFNEALSGVEDFDLWLRLAEKEYVFGYHDRVLSTYRIHALGTYESPKGNLMNAQYFADLLCKIEEESLCRKVQCTICNRYIRHGFYCKDIGDYVESYRSLVKAFQYSVSVRQKSLICLALCKLPFQAVFKKGCGYGRTR